MGGFVAGVPQTLGKHNARLRYQRVGGPTQVLDYEIYVVPPAHRIFADTDGNSMVMWQGTTAALDNPFLVVEGIDSENVSIQNHYYALAGDLLGRARSRGADVLMYNFRDGGLELNVNGDKLKLAIQYLNAIRVGSRRVDVAGLSMGGVITRYALAHMEAQGVAHNVERFVSVDAPQQGAVLDGDLLDWLWAPPPILITTRSLSANITSAAGKQLLVYNPFDRAQPTWHEVFYQYLNGINGDGYPHQTTENIGVSFGTSATNGYVGQEWLELDIPAHNNPEFYIEAGRREAQPGSLLPQEITRIADYAFGGFFQFRVFRSADPTFIPYASALDIVNGASRFDVQYAPLGAFAHNQFPPELIEPLLTRLGYPRPPFSVSITGPTQLSRGQAGTWTAAEHNGQPAYSYLWRYRYPCPPPPPCTGLICTEGAPGGDPVPMGGGGDPFGPSDPGQCGVWNHGGTSRSFSETFWVTQTVDIQLTATDGTSAAASSTRTVSVNDDGLGEGSNALTAEGGSSDALQMALQGAVPTAYALESPQPNPSAAGAMIGFDLPEPSFVRLVVYDALGREVAVLEDGLLEPGSYVRGFDGRGWSAGVYIVRLQAGAFSATHRLTLTR